MNIELPLRPDGSRHGDPHGKDRQVEISVGPRLLRQMKGHTGAVNAVAFSAGGRPFSRGAAGRGETGRSGSGTWPAERSSAGSSRPPTTPVPARTDLARGRARWRSGVHSGRPPGALRRHRRNRPTLGRGDRQRDPACLGAHGHDLLSGDLNRRPPSLDREPGHDRPALGHRQRQGDCVLKGHTGWVRSVASRPRPPRGNRFRAPRPHDAALGPGYGPRAESLDQAGIVPAWPSPRTEAT